MLAVTSPGMNYCGNRLAAEVLRRRIARYWARSSHRVTVWIEDTTHGGEPLYCVRSDLVGGLPRGLWEQQRAAAREDA